VALGELIIKYKPKSHFQLVFTQLFVLNSAPRRFMGILLGKKGLTLEMSLRASV
jgi:hypothetical protein